MLDFFATKLVFCRWKGLSEWWERWPNWRVFRAMWWLDANSSWMKLQSYKNNSLFTVRAQRRSLAGRLIWHTGTQPHLIWLRSWSLTARPWKVTETQKERLVFQSRHFSRVNSLLNFIKICFIFTPYLRNIPILTIDLIFFKWVAPTCAHFIPTKIGCEAMRNAEQFESESAVWQVKNASRLTYRDPSRLAKAYPSLRVAFSHLQMGQMEGWKTSLSFWIQPIFRGELLVLASVEMFK